MNKGGFSWKRAVGITRAKQRIARRTGIPWTKSGRQRKVGRIVTGGGCLLPVVALIVVIGCGGSTGVPSLAAGLLATDQPVASEGSVYTLPPKTLKITKVSLTSPVQPGDYAKVAVKTKPHQNCGIVVEYNSGTSTAAGLDNKTSSSSGAVSWKWRVGAGTAPGTYPITIICGDMGNVWGELDLEFRVK